MTYQPPGSPPPWQPVHAPYGGWTPAPPRPGCVPLRPLGVSDILDGSFQVIRRNPRTILSFSVALSAVAVILTTITQVIAVNQLGGQSVTSNGTSSPDLSSLAGGELAAVAGLLIRGVVGSILTGLLVVAITQDVLGVRISPAQAWARVRPRVGALIALSLATSLLEFLGLIPLFVLGVWLWGIWAVAIPAFIVEQTTIRGAWRRSTQLVRGTFWRVWGIRALGYLLVLVVSSVVTVPFEAIGLVVSGSSFGDLTHGHQPIALLLFTAIGSLVASTFTAPLLAGIESLLYVDLRMRREGLDIVLQQRAYGTGR